jgi:ABC-type uncharacterized transport system auxiliary subunit
VSANFKFRVLPLIFIGTVLSSCGGLLDSNKPIEKTYQLDPYIASQPAAEPPGRPGLSMSLTVVPGLDTDRMLTINPDAELNHFSGARWPEHLPELAESLFRRSLQSSGLFSRVSRSRDSGGDDCTMELEIQQFSTSIDRNSVASDVQIKLAGSFSCHDIQHSIDLKERVAVNTQGLPAVVRAHQEGINRLSISLLEQLRTNTL